MTPPREWVEPLVESGRALVEDEVDYWRKEITAPWRQGRKGRAASVGRWIGLGLAVGAAVAGLVAALRVERPWE